jgi:hypothetical protein
MLFKPFYAWRERETFSSFLKLTMTQVPTLDKDSTSK